MGQSKERDKGFWQRELCVFVRWVQGVYLRGAHQQSPKELVKDKCPGTRWYLGLEEPREDRAGAEPRCAVLCSPLESQGPAYRFQEGVSPQPQGMVMV
jgi:hypothetical protein